MVVNRRGFMLFPDNLQGSSAKTQFEASFSRWHLRIGKRNQDRQMYSMLSGAVLAR